MGRRKIRAYAGATYDPSTLLSLASYSPLHQSESCYLEIGLQVKYRPMTSGVDLRCLVCLYIIAQGLVSDNPMGVYLAFVTETLPTYSSPDRSSFSWQLKGYFIRNSPTSHLRIEPSRF